MAEEATYFVGANQAIDLLSDTDRLIAAAPDYYGPRFAAIAELRSLDDGTLHRGNEFRRVASLVNVPLGLAIKMQNPGFFKDRPAFYRWLNDPDKGGRYKTYDTRGGSRPSVTFTNGESMPW